MLAFGYILLKNPFSWQNVFGIGVAIVGMGIYSYVSLKESQQQKAAPEVASSQLPQVTHFFVPLSFFLFLLLVMSYLIEATKQDGSYYIHVCKIRKYQELALIAMCLPQVFVGCLPLFFTCAHMRSSACL